MIGENVLVLDIETKPKPFNDILDRLLDKKVRELSLSDAISKRLKYSFRSPVFANIICIGTLLEYDKSLYPMQFSDENNEEKILREFIQYISAFDGRGTYVHFNGLDFDIPFILTKCAIYGIDPPPNLCKLIRFCTYPHYDLMQVLTCWGKYPLSLEETSVMFGVDNPKDDLEGKNILEFLKSAKIEDISVYNMKDVNSTYAIYKKVCKIFK